MLVLTKPIGLGIITTAAKNDEDTLGAIGEAIRVMTTLNRAAAEVLAQFDVHALTDVTGFGLLGHLRNMTAASGVTAEVWVDAGADAASCQNVCRSRHRTRGNAGQRKFPCRLGDL